MRVLKAITVKVFSVQLVKANRGSDSYKARPLTAPAIIKYISTMKGTA